MTSTIKKWGKQNKTKTGTGNREQGTETETEIEIRERNKIQIEIYVGRYNPTINQHRDEIRARKRDGGRKTQRIER